MSAFLQAEAVAKDYGTIPALKNASFDVAKGEVLAIIGPNGAGKTTLFKVLTGEVEATRGKVVFEGRDITEMPAYGRTRLGFGRTFQVARIFQEFTALENAVVGIEARRRTAGELVGRWHAIDATADVVTEAAAILARVGLADKRGIEASFLSHGDRKRLELGLTLALRPSVLMLDEPTAGMSPADRQQTVELLSQIRRETGVTILLTEHDMDVVFGLADRVLVLNYGEMVALGPPAEIRANERVRELYLGEELTGA